MLKLIKRFFRTIIYFLAGLILWLRLGVPFSDAMRSSFQAKALLDELDDLDKE